MDFRRLKAAGNLLLIHIFNFKEPHFPGLKMSALYN